MIVHPSHLPVILTFSSGLPFGCAFRQEKMNPSMSLNIGNSTGPLMMRGPEGVFSMATERIMSCPLSMFSNL